MAHDAMLGELRTLETMGQVLRWARARSPCAEFADVVIQDEYNHDVVVRVDGPLHAVFGTTCLGAVLTVTLWDHRPDADEMLARRLASGWTPTPTATVDGDLVLGHAAKVAGCDVRSTLAGESPSAILSEADPTRDKAGEGGVGRS
jgi:hypothetical protein